MPPPVKVVVTTPVTVQTVVLLGWDWIIATLLSLLLVVVRVFKSEAAV